MSRRAATPKRGQGGRWLLRCVPVKTETKAEGTLGKTVERKYRASVLEFWIGNYLSGFLVIELIIQPNHFDPQDEQETWWSKARGNMTLWYVMPDDLACTSRCEDGQREVWAVDAIQEEEPRDCSKAFRLYFWWEWIAFTTLQSTVGRGRTIDWIIGHCAGGGYVCNAMCRIPPHHFTNIPNDTT